MKSKKTTTRTPVKTTKTAPKTSKTIEIRQTPSSETRKRISMTAKKEQSYSTQDVATRAYFISLERAEALTKIGI